MKKRFLYITLATVALLGGLHQIGSLFYLYWSVDWFDNIMHFLGGFSIGLFFIWLVFIYGVLGQKFLSSRSKIFNTFVFVILISFGWEIFERVYGITSVDEPGYYADTANDFLDAGLGAVLAGYIFKKKIANE